MDTDGDGVLSEKELMEGLRDAGYNISREQARKLVADLDRDGNGKLDFEEFIRMFDI
jgi:Ca2+-binding EF-hand superfamily protein